VADQSCNNGARRKLVRYKLPEWVWAVSRYQEAGVFVKKRTSYYDKRVYEFNYEGMYELKADRASRLSFLNMQVLAARMHLRVEKRVYSGRRL
jgi:hypothetical protein